MRTPMGQLWRHRFDETPVGTGLADRVERMLRAAVRARVLVPGAAVPSSRELARELGVSRNTVTIALERLVDAGILVSRHRSGYYVGEGASESLLAADADEALAALPAPDWSARLAAAPSLQRNIVKPLDWHRYPFPFVYGQVDATLFPHAAWRDCCERALRGADGREVLSDLIDRDDPMLVEQIRTRLLPRRGVWARDAEILVTVGAQHALYMAAQLLVAPGDTVGVEDPGYPDARNLFALRGAHVAALPVDDGGLAIAGEARERLAACRTLYLTPSHQCPTAATMPLARRRALLELAAQRDIALVEDDYEPETGPVQAMPTPALKSLDLAGRVVYLGSLSKTLAPGIRLGYVVADERLVTELRALRRLMLRHPSPHGQRALALFLADGHFDALTRRMRPAFEARAIALAQALRKHLPDWHIHEAAGGSARWVTLPGHLDAQALAARVREAGVLIEPGAVFHADPQQGRNTLRIGFSSIPLAHIEFGVAAIARSLPT